MVEHAAGDPVDLKGPFNIGDVDVVD